MSLGPMRDAPSELGCYWKLGSPGTSSLLGWDQLLGLRGAPASSPPLAGGLGRLAAGTKARILRGRSLLLTSLPWTYAFRLEGTTAPSSQVSSEGRQQWPRFQNQSPRRGPRAGVRAARSPGRQLALQPRSQAHPRPGGGKVGAGDRRLRSLRLRLPPPPGTGRPGRLRTARPQGHDPRLPPPRPSNLRGLLRAPPPRPPLLSPPLPSAPFLSSIPHSARLTSSRPSASPLPLPSPLLSPLLRVPPASLLPPRLPLSPRWGALSGQRAAGRGGAPPLPGELEAENLRPRRSRTQICKRRAPGSQAG